EHLDAADGPYWLRLEWRALARALRESGEQRSLAVRDALAFRQARHMLYAAYVDSERGQEITECLAAYTGTVLAAKSSDDARAGAIDLLENACERLWRHEADRPDLVGDLLDADVLPGERRTEINLWRPSTRAALGDG